MKITRAHTAGIILIAAAAAYSLWMNTNPSGSGSDRAAAVDQPDSSAVPPPASGPAGKVLEPRDMQVARMVSGDALNYRERDQACRGLSDRITESDVAVLVRFVSGSKPVGIATTEWHALFNDTLNQLRHQQRMPSGLTKALIAISANPDKDPVIRDYAVQHLCCLYSDRHPMARRENDPTLRTEILKAIDAEARRSGSAHAGTALIALNHIEMIGREPAEEKWSQSSSAALDDLALQLAAGGANIHQIARVAALQVCAMRGLRSVLPVARKLAGDDAVDAALRTSAIGCLGILGDPTDQPVLEAISNSGGRLALAASPAIQRIQSRN